ncbi:phosphatidylinositol 5-phosphate 4-kinase type-2 alpha-like [Styela clava]|uniref:phosphatidylinositol 5-phosphate 4-kinase type-2 alpha-like n=1 Tax=Styela clava TaxID=7725 RepID=UPI00193A819A|nr:phosphatidylinositol 5-phosphate 4-kinase type-2 alpha-like [Styela clava]
MATVQQLTKQKHRKKHFKKQKLKLFRANESVISVFMWGVNHTIKELSYIRCPLMLMPDDFKAYSKVKVDNHLYNKETLPSHFKVKEYCPMVFRRLRERFGIDDKEYANSLCLQQPVRVEDAGRSRARFLQSVDRKFVIKTLQSEDIAEMHTILPTYHQYAVEQGGQTLLPQYLGMYRLTLNNVEHYVLVTRNVMSNTLKTHKKYDLKGSTVQREASEKEKTKEFPTFKDNDFVKDNVKIYMDQEARESFLTMLKRDVEFLASLKLMDYSLLVGIHDRDREDRYNDRIEVPEDADTYNNGQDPDYSPGEDENGLLATPPDSPGAPLRQDSQEDDVGDVYRFNSAENSPKSVIYFMGLIDILTHYDAKKKAAHAVKTAKHGSGAEISTVKPFQYSKRFLEFINEHMITPDSQSNANAAQAAGESSS